MATVTWCWPDNHTLCDPIVSPLDQLGDLGCGLEEPCFADKETEVRVVNGPARDQIEISESLEPISHVMVLYVLF